MNNDRRYASRKFLLALLVLITGGTFRVLGYIDAAAWVDLTKWTLGLYFVGNVGTWAVDAAMKVKQ
jgi:hypothetical protein